MKPKRIEVMYEGFPLKCTAIGEGLESAELHTPESVGGRILTHLIQSKEYRIVDSFAYKGGAFAAYELKQI